MWVVIDRKSLVVEISVLFPIVGRNYVVKKVFMVVRTIIDNVVGLIALQW